MAEFLTSISGHYEELAAICLFIIGMMNLLLQSNMIKMIIGLNIMDVAVFLFLAANGYIEGRTAPIVVDGVTDTSLYINPIPAGLVLTGIVVSVSVSAVMMGITISLYRKYHTLELDQIMMEIRAKELQKAIQEEERIRASLQEPVELTEEEEEEILEEVEKVLSEEEVE